MQYEYRYSKRFVSFYEQMGSNGTFDLFSKCTIPMWVFYRIAEEHSRNKLSMGGSN